MFARYGYSPVDDNSFANRIFDPSAVDDFYTAPDAVKELILGYHANYSVVDPDLIDELYRWYYHEKVAGEERQRFCNVSRVADVVVYATGYRPTHQPAGP